MSEIRKPSHKLTFADAVEVWKFYISKHFVQRIAAHFDCNVGRVYQVLRAEIHSASKEQAVTELEFKNVELAATLRAFVFKPASAANDNQLDLFDDKAG
jgi:hypothetical protein